MYCDTTDYTEVESQKDPPVLSRERKRNTLTKESIVPGEQFKGPSKLSSTIRQPAADLNARGPSKEKW